MRAHDSDALAVAEVIDALRSATWDGNDATTRLATLRRVTGRAVVDRLLTLAADTDVDQDVRDIVEFSLAAFGAEAARHGEAAAPVEVQAHWRAISNDIARWLERRELPSPRPVLPPPPFDPF